MNRIGELVSSQWFVFLSALLLGVVLCFCYDVVRAVRRVIAHQMRMIIAEDFLYWIFWTLTVMTMLDALDKGTIRGFSLGAVFLGMLLYLGCFSRAVLCVLVFLFGWSRRIVELLMRFFLWPWKKIMILFHGVVSYNRKKFAAAGKFIREKRSERKQRSEAGDLHGEKNESNCK